jgi:hypothetical protein
MKMKSILRASESCISPFVILPKPKNSFTALQVPINLMKKECAAVLKLFIQNRFRLYVHPEGPMRQNRLIKAN